MPRIKLTDEGGYSTSGEGVEIDVTSKYTRSNEGCIQGWSYPVSGSVASSQIIIGASGPGNSASATNSARAPYDGSAVIDMRNFVRVGNIVKIRVFVAIKDETGTANDIKFRLVSSESKYHINKGTVFQVQTTASADISTPPEFIAVDFIQFIYNIDDLKRVQLLGHNLEYTRGNDPDVEIQNAQLDTWNSVSQPYWHVTTDIDGTEDSSNFWGMKITVDTEFIGKRSD